MADQIAGLTSSDVLSWWVTVFGAGSGGAIFLAWLGWQRAKSEARKEPPEDQRAAGYGLADRHVVEQLDRLHDHVGEVARAIERLFGAVGRHHGETSDRLNRLADRIERGIDEGRDTRRAVEDLRGRIEDDRER